MTLRLATDIGGTFTDLALLEDGGIGEIVKTPTTPIDPSEGRRRPSGPMGGFLASMKFGRASRIRARKKDPQL